VAREILGRKRDARNSLRRDGGITRDRWGEGKIKDI
jgi:hypothetical protein